MKIAFIHNEKKLGTGSHYINDLMASKLAENGVKTKNFYPSTSLIDTPIHLGGIKFILFFYSLLEHRKNILKFDLVQGTTYTPLPFLAYSIPVVSHFGSTTRGFLNSTPRANDMESTTRKIWYTLKKQGAIQELNIKTRRPMRDIADIEEYVASKATAVIVTSENVKRELLSENVPAENIHLIHNAIEDYWFESSKQVFVPEPSIVFLGRLGSDPFTLKLKGLDRLIHLYQHFPNVKKITFCITTNKPLLNWLKTKILNHTIFANTKKDELPGLLKPLCGSILFIPSRYEGFSLSLIEGMSQGLVPIVYPIGVAPEIIRNGENGFIVHSQAEAIEKAELLLTNKELREKLSSEAYKTAKMFTGRAITNKLIELYTLIMARSKDTQKSTKID